MSTQIEDTVAGVACLVAVQTGDCGNGVVETGEQCDDGNGVSGDGCSAGCWIEGCGNGVVELAEGCDDGNTTPGDGCSSACQVEPRCGDGTTDAGEECDDGDEESGDGCSAVCQQEPCTVVKSAQTIWPVARVTLRRPGSPKDRLLVRGDFGLALAVGVAESRGLRDARHDREQRRGAQARPDAARRRRLGGAPGPLALSRPARDRRRDPEGPDPATRRSAGCPTCRSSSRGRAAATSSAPEDLPLAVTMILGDATAGSAGACGRYAFGGGSCSAPNRASRLVCR